MTELAEGARLEIVCAVTSGTEGSNPSLSAIKLQLAPRPDSRFPMVDSVTMREGFVGGFVFNPDPLIARMLLIRV